MWVRSLLQVENATNDEVVQTYLT